MLKHLYSTVRSYLEIVKLQYRFRIKGGTLDKPYRVLNSKYMQIGRNVKIRKDSRIECLPLFQGNKYNPQIIFGDGVHIGYNCTFLCTDLLQIDRDTILAGGCMISTENHGVNPESAVPYHAQPLTSAPVHIGAGCWLGQNVCVLPGVTIGRRCIIGTNAVVNKDIPDYSIAVGVPARVVKTYNFNKHIWENQN